MPGPQHICLKNLLGPETLGLLKQEALRTHGRDVEPVLANVEFLDEELELFQDWDYIACRGTGFFAYDEAENASRRIDARTPLDFDPGPIEMPGADEHDTAGVVLDFRKAG